MPKPARPYPSIATEQWMHEGALQALDLLHADLIMRRDEARDESARETWDEVLTQVDALLTEYRRRLAALPQVSAHHASYVFLLDEAGEIHPIPHRLYVALDRDECVNPQFAGKTLRLAEWYVRLERGAPAAVVNETWALLTFDREGRVDWSATPAFHPHRDGAVLAAETAALPSPAERERMLALLFGSGEAGPAEH
jgi:hypothetical protein